MKFAKIFYSAMGDFKSLKQRLLTDVKAFDVRNNDKLGRFIGPTVWP